MPLIRAAAAADLDDLYEICLRTGDGGADASAMFDDPRLLGEVYVGPYVVLASGMGLTAVDRAGPAAYALATADTRRFEAECEEEWWPPLRTRYADPGPGPVTPDQEIMALIHRPQLASPDLVADFPAHLHIDLLPRVQGRGIGRVLMERLLGELDSSGVPGVHLQVDARNDRAIGFYRHLGFVTLEAKADVVAMGLPLNER